ncbi:MAG: heavy metal translocating P-type ATPase [Pikeienuella sp.]
MRDTTETAPIAEPQAQATDQAAGCGCGCGAALAEPPKGAEERWARSESGGRASVDLMVPGIHCAGCMARIERDLGALPGVEIVRVNLSLRRANVIYDPARSSVAAISDALEQMGYDAKPFDAAAMAEIDRDSRGRDLLARLGVAGFAAMNVMLLSVSVWSGAEAATRDLMHWISALIAIPAIAFSGRPFFVSAAGALKGRRLNMDVPISLAILLAAGSSLYETSLSGPHAYFDASLGLIFFLLLGRYLDHRTRAAARSAAAELTAMAARSATVIGEDGSRHAVATDEIAHGALIEVAPGERIPADGAVEEGSSDLDRSLVTGESTPEAVHPGDQVHAGMLNLSGLIRMRAAATGEKTLLAEIARMIEAAEHGKTRYDRWADRAARLYSPGVHIIALVAFIGWYGATEDLRLSITIACALLIITCPCALGLAVPAVHAAAGGRLFRRGIFLKDGAALERLAEADMVAFDKTGTLTTGHPQLAQGPEEGHPAWSLALALAAGSRHPLAQALAEAARSRGVIPAAVEELREVPGSGVEASHRGRTVRLGSAIWTGAAPGEETAVHLCDGTGTRLAFIFTEVLREDAPDVSKALGELGLSTVLLSGDGSKPVARIAEAAGIPTAKPRLTPADKLAALEGLRADGRRVLMVGDGINDAPALAAATASMSPVNAADVSRAAADLVFTGEKLAPVPFAIRIARTARSRAMQNFAIATAYNAIAIPIAMAGMVTPLIAALAMSASSIIVTLNAIRRWPDT